jgi:hypothetical protein
MQPYKPLSALWTFFCLSSLDRLFSYKRNLFATPLKIKRDAYVNKHTDFCSI